MKDLMEPRIVMIEEFKVMGISARTSNENEINGNGKIPDLWMRFQNERVIEQIPSRSDSSIVAVYTDYESDEKGLYTLVVGGKTNHPVSTSDEMTVKVKEVPAGKYLVFTSPQGIISKVVFETGYLFGSGFCVQI